MYNAALNYYTMLKSQFATNRQTDKSHKYLSQYTGGCLFFLVLNFSDSLLALLAGGFYIWYVHVPRSVQSVLLCART